MNQCGQPLSDFTGIDSIGPTEFEQKLEKAAKKDKAMQWMWTRFGQLNKHWKPITNSYSDQSETKVLVFMGLLDKSTRMNIREGLDTGGESNSILD